MAISDSISDALTIIRNAVRTGKDRADIKASKMMVSILKVLREQKFIHDYRKIDDKKQGLIRVYISKKGEPTRRITQIQRVSRPGLRKYSKTVEIPTVLSGYGICLVSTPQGVLSGDEAKKRGVGGEIICKIW